MIEEREGEWVYICDTCGEEYFGDNWGLAGCLVLTDERVQPPEVIGVWCDETCLNKWLDKPDGINFQTLCRLRRNAMLNKLKEGETYTGEELIELCGERMTVGVIGKKASAIAVDAGNDNWKVIKILTQEGGDNVG